MLRPADTDLAKLATMIADAKTVAILGGDGCRDARKEVLALADTLKAPIGYSFRGKQWLEHDNPFAVGMTGLLGYGGAYDAINDADLLLLLGTDFPFTEFLPQDGVKKVQIDRRAKHIGRRTKVDLALVGDVKATLTELLPKVNPKSDTGFLDKHLAETRDFYDLLNHYVEKGPGIKPIRPRCIALMKSEARSGATSYSTVTSTGPMSSGSVVVLAAKVGTRQSFQGVTSTARSGDRTNTPRPTGYFAKPNSAPAVVNLIYLPMSFCSGLWIPLFLLPHGLQALAKFLPPFHLAQLALSAVGLVVNPTPAWGHVEALITFALICLGLAAWGYRRDEGKTYG